MKKHLKKASNYIDKNTPWSFLVFVNLDSNKFTGTIGNRVININQRYKWSLVPYKTTISYNPYDNDKCSVVVTTESKKYYMKLNIILMIALYTLIIMSQFLDKYPKPYYFLTLFLILSIPNIYYFNKAYISNQKRIDSFIRQLYSYYFINK